MKFNKIYAVVKNISLVAPKRDHVVYFDLKEAYTQQYLSRFISAIKRQINTLVVLSPLHLIAELQWAGIHSTFF